MLKYLLLLFITIPAFAKLQVITTTPDIAWALKELGGERVEVKSLLTGSEDPHFVDALPSFIHRAAKANMLCFVGLDLEVGWLPNVLKRSGNRVIQKGGKGYCDFSKTVTAIEIPPANANRSMGDVHAAGNPHYYLSPKSMIEASEGVVTTLIENDPAGAEYFLAQQEKYIAKLKEVEAKVKKMLTKVKGKTFIEYHKEFSYFFKNYEIESFSPIEEVPGVSPSAGQLIKIALKAKKARVDYALAGHSGDDKVLAKFSEVSGIPVGRVQAGLNISKINDYNELQVHIANELLKATN